MFEKYVDWSNEMVNKVLNIQNEKACLESTFFPSAYREEEEVVSGRQLQLWTFIRLINTVYVVDRTVQTSKWKNLQCSGDACRSTIFFCFPSFYANVSCNKDCDSGFDFESTLCCVAFTENFNMQLEYVRQNALLKKQRPMRLVYLP